MTPPHPSTPLIQMDRNFSPWAGSTWVWSSRTTARRSAPSACGEAAVAAEGAGFDSGWVTDHVIVPAELAPVYGTIAEAIVSLGFLAGRTQRIQLGVSALVVAQRNPFVVLKQVTSLDFPLRWADCHGGCCRLASKEFATVGSQFESRWTAARRVARAGSLEFRRCRARSSTRGLAIRDGWLAPGLVRPDGMEGVGGRRLGCHPASAARTGAWHPVALPPATLSELAARAPRRADGRIVLRPSTLFAGEPNAGSADERGRHAVSGPPQWIAERLGEYIEAGCNGFVVNLGHDAPGLDERIQRFAEEVWAPVLLSSSSGPARTARSGDLPVRRWRACSTCTSWRWLPSGSWRSSRGRRCSVGTEVVGEPTSAYQGGYPGSAPCL